VPFGFWVYGQILWSISILEYLYTPPTPKSSNTPDSPPEEGWNTRNRVYEYLTGFWPTTFATLQWRFTQTTPEIKIDIPESRNTLIYQTAFEYLDTRVYRYSHSQTDPKSAATWWLNAESPCFQPQASIDTRCIQVPPCIDRHSSSRTQLNINFITRPPILRSEQNAYLGKGCELELLIGRNLKVAFAGIIPDESAAEAHRGQMFTAVMKQHQTSSGNIFWNWIWITAQIDGI